MNLRSRDHAPAGFSTAILVVEDSRTQAEQLRYLLEENGYRVTTAANGKEALVILRQERPTLVISDIIMPEMDGYQLCRQIKSDQTLRDIPVILLTSLSDPHDVVKGLQCHADNFITKPYDEKYLLSILQYVLMNRELRRHGRTEMGLEIIFEGEKYFITSDHQQILDMLLSTYESAVERNRELGRAQDELKALNEALEEKVRKRTAALTAEIAERRRIEETLRTSERRFRALIENSSDAIALVDAEGVIIYESPSVSRILGYAPEELVGRIALELLHPDDLALGRARFAQLLQKAGSIVTGEFRLPHKNGSWRWIEAVGANLLAESSVKAIVANYRDITERRQAEAERERLANDRLLLLESTGEGIFGMDLEGRCTFVNKSAAKMLGHSSAEVLGKDMHALIHYVRADGTPYPAAECPIYRAVQTGQGCHVDTEVFWRQDGTPFPVEYTAYPISEQGAVKGAVVTFGDITERKQRARQMEAIVTVATALRTAITRVEMLPVILDQTRVLLKAESAALMMRDPNSGDTVIELARGTWAPITGERIPAGHGVGGEVIATGKPFLDNDVQSEPLQPRGGTRSEIPVGDVPALRPHAQHPGILRDLKAVACAPLITQTHTLGALWVGRRSAIGAEDMRLLAAIADIAANALHRASLYEETQRRLQRITALRAIDMAITSSLDPRVTLDVLLTQVTNQLNIHAADILLLNPYSRVLEYAAGHGLRSKLGARARTYLGEGPAGRAALERSIVSIAELQSRLADFPQSAIRDLQLEGFVSYYAAPLIAKGQVKGVLEIFHRARIEPDQEWLEFLEALATQAAIALDNATLFERLERSNLELGLAYDATIEGWSRALDLRDKETEGHTQRVTEMTLRLTRALEMSEEEMVHVRRGALLHDIGKMGIPDSILLKPGALTAAEWEIMRKHPLYAYELLAPIAYLRPALDIPHAHHEKWDGSGYPQGLQGDAIPLSARIFAVVDVWDALLSDRPYRAAWSQEQTLEYIRQQSGKHFDPEAVEAFFRVLG